MDDHRIEQALREGPPDEPRYVPGAVRDAARQDDETRTDVGEQSFSGRVNGRGVLGRATLRPPRSPAGRLGWLLPLAAAVIVVVAGLAIRSNLGPGATSSAGPNDMLGHIRAGGVVHIAVSNEAPQAQTTGGAYIGFDVDVANAVAGWIGVRPDLQFVSPNEILRGTGDWELAFPSHTLPDSLTAAVAGPHYYMWPAWLIVEDGSAFDSIAALNGTAICVVDGAPGADWLAGASTPDTAYVASAPLDASIVRRATDELCLAALASGEAQAAVTATLLDVDFASRGLRSIAGSPVIRQQRALLIRTTSTFGDTTTFQAAVEAALTDLRTTGQLAELSRRAFGGDDLTGDLP